MDLEQVIISIGEKATDPWAKVTDAEFEMLEANLDIPTVKCFYALALLINSSFRFGSLLRFEDYDEKQLKAFEFFNKALEEGEPLSLFYLAEVKCGLFGKFPMFPEEGKILYQRYYDQTGDAETKDILDNWEEFLRDRKQRFDDLVLTERVRELNLPQTGLGSHDDAYYESLSEDDED